ncbi:MAG: glutamine-hydrolyzing carbamoyl-phosphate synthase small subunit [Candidatus Diapherotrites archaeon]|nr:glutamine-hydrolyzing carbamoyl-phosphate synthase small subunit [Candidatus Diapherotrites archaeon]
MLGWVVLDQEKQTRKAKLILEDGSTYDAISFGYEKSVSGEVVFNTGMTGYCASLTDPSYKGQILIQTFPLIGNYGVSEETDELGFKKGWESEKVQVTAYLVSENCSEPSHWGPTKTLQEWLKEQKIPALCGLDTRALTRKIREKGVMLGKIEFLDVDNGTEIEDPNRRNLIAEVSTNEVKEYGNGKDKVLLIDCGAKNNIIRSLVKRDFKVIRVPWDYDPSNVEYDVVMVSNGPGDPKMGMKTIENLKKIMQKGKPILGICMGNQLLGLAAGANTYKLPYGHRSQNQPCLLKGTERCYITSQNHGYAINADTLPDDWEVWFTNANDNTVEGIKHKTKPFKSVQFHPEACPGPTDTEFLFDELKKMVKRE